MCKKNCHKYYVLLSELYATMPVAMGIIGEIDQTLPVYYVNPLQGEGSPTINNYVITATVYSNKKCTKVVGTVLFNLYTLTNESVENFKNRVTTTGTLFIDGKKTKCDSTLSLTTGLNVLEMDEKTVYKTKTISGTGEFDKVNNLSFKQKAGVIEFNLRITK